MFAQFWRFISRAPAGRKPLPTPSAARWEDTDVDSSELGDLFAHNEEYFPGCASVAGLEMAPAYLHLLSEPPLAPHFDAVHDCFRLLWMPSFKPTIVVRIEGKGENHQLVAKSWEGFPHVSKGRPLLNASRALTLEDSRAFEELAERASFWRLGTRSTEQGLDGDYWVLEGRSATKHHVVVRWSPKPDGPDRAFRELCLFILRLGGQEPE